MGRERENEDGDGGEEDRPEKERIAADNGPENTTIDGWFDGIRGKTEAGFIDVALLQETRATERWKEQLERKYAEGWGLRTGDQFNKWSFWGPAPTAAGGVAILVRPGGRVVAPRPIWEEHWSQWFMAIEFEVEGVTYTVINVYGPTDKSQREELYGAIASLRNPAGMVLVGGDFNCTLDDALDRSFSTQHSHDSPALHEWLAGWKLKDTLQDEQNQIRTEAERRHFHTTRHTYRYAVRDDEQATSRLDRFYVDMEHAQHVRHTEVIKPLNDSDHDGVLVVIADRAQPPEPRVRRRRPRLRYPLPFGTNERVSEISKQCIQVFELGRDHTPAISAGQWVAWKTELRRQCLTAIRMTIKRLTKAHKQRKRRLQKALRAIVAYTGTTSTEGSLEGITKGMESLTINGYARAKAIRAELIRISKTRSRRLHQQRFAQYTHGHPDAERNFFQRFKVRQGGGKLEDPSSPTEHGQSPANRLARDWQQITQRGDRHAEARNAFFEALPTRPKCLELETLDRDFTEDEVRQAILACPRRKAPGPDGIPNDWYRDNVDDVTGMLTALFNEWHHAGVLPGSFRKAMVACIPKTTRPRTGLDFRPIALLDSDYKIYPRLLLNRIRSALPQLVTETQYGFVPGRQVHDALDVFHALQALVKSGTAPPTALAISLDFVKAYDTLDRPFLLQALERIGCPPRFLQAIRQMHLATTAAYMADADISEDQRVLNGIRQGCPLAPTLFVLAVDTLYQAINAHPDIQGVQLPSGDEVRIAGYADDTTMYPRGPEVVPHILGLLTEFEAASGLGINVGKCVVVALHDRVRPPDDIGFPVAAVTDMNRLLGGQISSDGTKTKVWDLTVQQLRTRLRAAETKTTNVLQRIRITKAILVPKFAFVARHHWPTSEHVQRVQRLAKNFVWKGSLATTPPPGRAWLSEDVAALPASDGGLGLPILTHVLQELSVRVVARWATPGAGLRAEIGRVRLRHHKAPDGHTAISRKAPTKPTLQATLTGTGRQLRHALEIQRRDDEETALATELLQAAGRGTSENYSWEDGRLCVRYEHSDSMKALVRSQSARFGNLHVAALLTAPIIGEDILLGRSGEPVTAADFAGLVTRRHRIGDVVHIEWIEDNRLAFRCRTQAFPLQDKHARAFRRLCDYLVYNYPTVLRDPGPEADLQTVVPTMDIWQLRKQADRHELWWNPIGDVWVEEGTVKSTAEATKAARYLSGNPDTKFQAHIWIDDVRSLWRGKRAPTREDAGATVMSSSRERGLEAVATRERIWQEHHPTIAEALETVDWGEILKVLGAPATHCLLLHRLKSRRLSGWSRAHGDVRCPHCPDAGPGGGRPEHFMWACPAAQQLWAALRAGWAPLHTADQRGSEEFERSVFQLRLDAMPDKLWEHPEIKRLPEPTTADTSATHQALQAIWRTQVLATFHAIWRWRTAADAPEDIWTTAQASRNLPSTRRPMKSTHPNTSSSSMEDPEGIQDRMAAGPSSSASATKPPERRSSGQRLCPRRTRRPPTTKRNTTA